MRHLILFLAAFPLFSFAQNVGIGTPTPAEKLDVSGNINLNGALKVSGNAGNSGQVLMSTGTGLSWGSMMNYRKCVVFYSGSGSWTVPAGVTEVMAELWGGGSGGTAYSGGTSGGYARTVQTVTPGYSISYIVGSGSAFGASNTSSGGNTQCTFPFGYIQATGGGGVVDAQDHGLPTSGTGALSSNYFYMFGNPGKFNVSEFGQKNATTYVETVQYGAGGAPVGMFNSVPMEGDRIRYENGASVTYNYSGTSYVPSAGGAAGQGSGWFGGTGMIIFWFNN